MPSPNSAGFVTNGRNCAQAQETPRHFVERESRYLWGRRYLLSVVEKDAKPAVTLHHRRITRTVRHGSTRDAKRLCTNGIAPYCMK